MSKVYKKTELPVIIPLGGVNIQSEPPQLSVPDHPSSIANATQTEFVEDPDAEMRIDRSKQTARARKGKGVPRPHKWSPDYTNDLFDDWLIEHPKSIPSDRLTKFYVYLKRIHKENPNFFDGMDLKSKRTIGRHLGIWK